VDCDEYARMLVAKDWSGVQKYLLEQGVDRVVRAGCNLICIVRADNSTMSRTHDEEPTFTHSSGFATLTLTVSL
jgi:hypothetical protein